MIIQRYIAKEILFTCVAVTMVLSLIYSLGIFIRFLSAAASGTLQAKVIFPLMGLKYISVIPVLIPIAFYFSILIALGRLYKDSEMTAMAACGAGINKVLVIIFNLSLLLCAALLVITLYIGPWAERQSQQIITEAEATADITSLADGKFKEVSSANLVFYAEKAKTEEKEMQNVFANRFADGTDSLLTAEKAYQYSRPNTGDDYIEFTNGYRYEGTPGKADFKIVSFSRYGFRIPQAETKALNLRTAAKTTDELWNSDNINNKAELQWRFALANATIVLALLSVALSRSDPRKGRFGKLFIAILVYLIYNNLLGIAETWYVRGNTLQILGLWWVHLVFLGLFVVLMVRHLGLNWVLKLLTGKVLKSP